ncbi:MAG: flagellar biosynthesis protein FliQ [Thermovenabulum sp.]|uniref:flagellar biosynthesis protein FliQ n=1 Tax=Thermovenabulum sp. TaxID=3100335 RepID=UPI003C7A6A2F
MTQETVIYLAREALGVALLVSAPILGLSMLVGLIISILQATTQIHEQTLTFIPKIIAAVIALLIFGPWMLTTLLHFAETLFTELPNFIN